MAVGEGVDYESMGKATQDIDNNDRTAGVPAPEDYALENWGQITDVRRRPLVIAEISANHLGSLERAKTLVKVANESGADIVKFQHYRPDTITVRSKHPDFSIGGGSLWAGRDLWSLYEEAMMPWEWTAELVKTCEEEGIDWFSSPFDETAVDFLERFDPPMYKVASFEIVDIPLVQKIAQTGRPMIISTGMATEQEISDAVEAARGEGSTDLALLRTNSAYPAPVDEMDLRAIPFMAAKWGLPVGLSDHTLDNTSAIVATALGSRAFEKHLTLKRSDGGPDSAFSLEPEEFADYVRQIDAAFHSLGTNRLGPSPREIDSLRFRPSIRAVKDIRKGELLTAENVATVRPAGGLHTRLFSDVVGRVAAANHAVGDPILKESLDD